MERLCKSVSNKHRTSRIMRQITKTLLIVILKIIRANMTPQTGEEQLGFVAENVTANALFTLRVLTERALEVQKDVIACFVNHEKAFDKVRHEKY